MQEVCVDRWRVFCFSDVLAEPMTLAGARRLSFHCTNGREKGDGRAAHHADASRTRAHPARTGRLHVGR